MPVAVKLKGFKTKWVLKRLVSDLLPRKIVRRRKQALLVSTNSLVNQ